jgi:uroporphyrinogen III methyltransferase/synthase
VDAARTERGAPGAEAAAQADPAAGAGFVYLVGAGPGDPGLLTARAIEVLGRADVILHDRLVPAEALRHARPDAVVVDVGKVGGGEQVPQAETERLLVEHARAGRVVVRLKGGDPFVFGRGGEEARVLREAGIGYEVVPGVTAGIAAPAYAGIPVTFRGAASAVAFVTGHEDPAKPQTAIDWPALAAFPGTLVFYMGVRQLARICEQLIAAGRPAGEPAAIVERGTLPGQRSIVATLGTLPARAAEAQIRAPAVTVVGDVAALGGELGWFERRPLSGRTIVVTRARSQASALAARLRELGAAVVEAPAIRIEPLPIELPEIASFDLLCVTSPNGAERLLEEVRDARALAGPRIAAIGPGTARALRAGGIEPDIVPERAVAEALVEALADVPVRRALIARAAEARDVLPDALRARGAEVVVAALYRTVAEPLDDAVRDAALAADYVTFASASAVRSFLRAAGGTLAREGPGAAAGTDRPAGDARPRLVSIGPATSAALREAGLEPDVEATVHTPDGLVEALLADASARPAAEPPPRQADGSARPGARRP